MFDFTNISTNHFFVGLTKSYYLEKCYKILLVSASYLATYDSTKNTSFWLESVIISFSVRLECNCPQTNLKYLNNLISIKNF